MLSLRELRYIMLVAETGNFGKAARKAGVSQSALSQAILAAEKRSGVKLFIRDKHGVAVTESGQLVADGAGAILNDVAELEAQIDAHRTARAGRVRFGIAPIPASIFLIETLTRYVRRFPQLHPEFVVDFWEVLLPKLLAGEIAFFIAGRHEMLDDRRLTRRTFFRDSVVIAARPNHPLATGSPVPASEFVRYPVLTHREPRELREMVRRKLRDASDLDLMRGNLPAAMVHDLRPYFPIVEKTDYLMFSARTTFKEMFASRRFTEIPISGVEAEISMDIVTRVRHRQTPAATALIETFEAVRASLRP